MKNWLRTLLLVLFSAVFLVSACFLGKYLLDSRQHQGQFDDLAQLVEQAKPPVATTPDPTSGTQPETQPAEVPDIDTGTQILPEYAQLYQMNSDLVGWIAIDDTKINYPVMQTPEQPDYYLYRDFYCEYSSHGCIYVRDACDVTRPSDNVVIYGHRMKDGSMFCGLREYESKDFYESHQYIRFDTLTQRHTYQILAVFKTVATESGYPYHLFVDAADEAAFDAYVADCKAMALYDTGVDAVYGDKLITLSTCEYSQDNGRMVVVAKRISESI